MGRIRKESHTIDWVQPNDKKIIVARIYEDMKVSSQRAVAQITLSNSPSTINSEPHLALSNVEPCPPVSCDTERYGWILWFRLIG